MVAGSCGRTHRSLRVPISVTVLIVVLIAHAAPATTYYVDYDGGSDANDGTSPATAFKRCPGDELATGVAGATVLVGGDTVIFKGGVYYRSLADSRYLRTVKVGWSGEPGAPITYDGNTAGTFGEGRAIIDGSVPVTGWVACESAEEADGNPHWAHLYTTTISGRVVVTGAQMHEDDQLLVMAQEPDVVDPFFSDDLDTFRQIDQNIGANTLTDPSFFTQTDPSYWVGASLRLYVVPNSVVWRVITAYDPATGTVTFDRSVNPYTNGSGLYAVVNHMDALNAPGEYVVSTAPEPDGSHRVWLWPRGDDPNAATITWSVRKTGIDLVGRNHLVVQGFIIQKHASGVREYRDGNAIRTFSGGTDITIRDNVMRWNFSGEKSATLRMYGTGDDDCIDILIEDNQIYENPHNPGMNIDGLRVLTQNNYLRGNGGTAIDYYGCRDSQLLGNVVEGHRGVHANGLTLYLGCTNCLVAYNTVTDGNVAFTVKDGTDITIAYNVFHAAQGHYAVADWGRCDGLNYYNNVMLNDDGGAIAVGSSTINVVAKNNIMDGSSVAHAGGISEHNIFTSLSWTQNPGSLGVGEFEATREELFVDAVNHDYRLKPGSPAIDAGVAIAGLTRDHDGTSVPQGAAPDVGAFEFEMPPPVADAGPDQTVIDTDGDGFKLVWLNGSASHFPGGTITGYIWTHDAIPLGFSAITPAALPVGEHTITLEVTASNGVKAFDTVTITVLAAKPGDCNGDGNVDLDDFVILKQNFGRSGVNGPAEGDLNGDGNVDLDDFVILKQNFGT